MVYCSDEVGASCERHTHTHTPIYTKLKTVCIYVIAFDESDNSTILANFATV